MCIRTGDFLCRKVYMFTSAAGPPLCTLCAGGEQPASLHYLVAIFGRHREHRKGDKFLYFFAHTNASRQNRMGTHGHKRKSEGINSDNLVSALTGVDIAVRVARSQRPHSIVQFPASTSACRKPQTGAAASVGPGAAASIKVLKEILALHDHACRAAACALPRNAVPSWLIAPPQVPFPAWHCLPPPGGDPAALLRGRAAFASDCLGGRGFRRGTSTRATTTLPRPCQSHAAQLRRSLHESACHPHDAATWIFRVAAPPELAGCCGYHPARAPARLFR